VAEPTIRRRALRERIEKTRHRYWGKGGQVNVPELADQMLSFLHEHGVRVVDNDWEPGFCEPPASADWPARFRAAAEEAEKADLHGTGSQLRELALRWPSGALWPVVEAIGRALSGEAATTNSELTVEEN
jgi:hypothetical protein